MGVVCYSSIRRLDRRGSRRHRSAMFGLWKIAIPQKSCARLHTRLQKRAVGLLSRIRESYNMSFSLLHIRRTQPSVFLFGQTDRARTACCYRFPGQWLVDHASNIRRKGRISRYCAS